MRAVFFAALAALAFVPGVTAQQTASAPADAVITVEFSNPDLSPSQWTLTLHPDGRGHFRSMSAIGPAVAADPPGELRTPDLDRDIQLSSKFAMSVFETAARHKWFAEPCESHLKVAFQGWKTLSYAGLEGNGSCRFNFSRDREIQSLGDTFMAVAQTIMEGARLEMLLQHDPLGLDKEIDSLVVAAKDGRAQQLEAIKGILERLAGDENVMEMVRKRARMLMAGSSF
jgi:hypothetical protein